MNAARTAAIVPLALGAYALAAHLLVARAPAIAASGLAQPLPVVTGWNAFGALLLGALIAASALAWYAYRRVVAALNAPPATGARVYGAIAAAAAIALLCAWGAPAIFSSDVYAYAAYGEMARAGLDPYAHAALPHGSALLDAAIWQWGNPPPACVYGPAFVLAAALVVSAAAPLGTLGQLDGLRLLATASLALCAILAPFAFGGSVRERLAAAATIGLNPVGIWCAAEGHNDALALAVALGGFALVRCGRTAAGGAIVALSALVKAPGLVAAVPLALAAPRARVGAIAGIAVALLASLPLLRSVAAHGAPGGHYAAEASVQAIFGAYPPLAIVVALALCALLVRAGTRRLVQGEAVGWAYLALGAWVLVPNPYPWYGLWLLPVAALAPGTRAALALLLLSLSSLLRYVPDAIGAPNEFEAVLLGLAAALPLLALVPRSAIMGGPSYDR